VIVVRARRLVAGSGDQQKKDRPCERDCPQEGQERKIHV
jgi:hypothetical protein